MYKLGSRHNSTHDGDNPQQEGSPDTRNGREAPKNVPQNVLKEPETDEALNFSQPTGSKETAQMFGLCDWELTYQLIQVFKQWKIVSATQ